MAMGYVKFDNMCNRYATPYFCLTFLFFSQTSFKTQKIKE